VHESRSQPVSARAELIRVISAPIPASEEDDEARKLNHADAPP
jgi:hypothetical protein